jgi:3-phosphoshikimate 1-carboxyvinyltransferase
LRISIRRVATLQGELRPPSDKSLTHRAYMLAAAAKGKSVVRNALRGEDCQATLECLKQMGLQSAEVEAGEQVLEPATEWRQPQGDLYCGNSGTTMRLLSGLIASRPLDVVMTGDASLSKRPMKRIAAPLRMMGATVEGDTPPLRIVGSSGLRGIRYESPVASAQVKSCALLAGLRAEGETWVSEPSLSRDHMERMLRALGVEVLDDGRAVGVRGGSSFDGFMFDVPGDISSAAFFMVAAALLPQARLRLHDVNVNPTRTGILDVLRECRVPLHVSDPRDEMGEPVACIEVGGDDMLGPFEIGGATVPRLIDEIPVLAVLATQCDGVSRIRDAGELRVKESDRIELIAAGLRAMGAEVETYPDGMSVAGPIRLHGAAIDAVGDHRIAMAFAVAGLIADGETVIDGAESIATSFPEFEKELWRLCVV